MKVTSIKIDENIWKNVKIEAIKNNTTVAKLTEEALVEKLQRMKDSGIVWSN